MRPVSPPDGRISCAWTGVQWLSATWETIEKRDASERAGDGGRSARREAGLARGGLGTGQPPNLQVVASEHI